jgi:hypothetical protein
VSAFTCWFVSSMPCPLWIRKLQTACDRFIESEWLYIKFGSL